MIILNIRRIMNLVGVTYINKAKTTKQLIMNPEISNKYNCQHMNHLDRLQVCRFMGLALQTEKAHD